MKKKLTVITDERGQVVATQVGHGDTRDPQSGIQGSLVPGPRQQLHKIEYDVPELRSSKDIDEFHKKLSEHIKASTKKP